MFLFLSISQEKSSSLSFHHRHSSQSYPEFVVSVLDGPICASQLLRCRWTQGKRPWTHAPRLKRTVSVLVQTPLHIPVSCSLFGQGESKSNPTFTISKENLSSKAAGCEDTETSRVKCIYKSPLTEEIHLRADLQSIKEWETSIQKLHGSDTSRILKQEVTACVSMLLSHCSSH